MTSNALAKLIRSRLNSGGWALLLLILIEVLNGFLSRELTVGQMANIQSIAFAGTISILWISLIVLLILVAGILWALNLRRQMRLAIFAATSLLSLQLLISTLLLVARLLQNIKVSVSLLWLDAIIIFVTNILIFTLWYWFIDSATTHFFVPVENPSWDFLFPQRQATYPGYEVWKPQFFDYIFLAFTTSVAFSPTDTLPLSRAAKMLMMMQSAIALITITVVVGTAINALAGSS
jgi:hypothetical protein